MFFLELQTAETVMGTFGSLQRGYRPRFRRPQQWRAAETNKKQVVEAQTAVSDQSAPKPALTTPLILVAEDNASNLAIILDILHFKGYRTLVAHNGQEAVELTYSHQPDLILMDIQMPKMDGMEATRRLRKDEKTAVLPIIALTGLAMTGDKERILAAGANAYLSKPIRLKTLIEIIEQHLA